MKIVVWIGIALVALLPAIGCDGPVQEELGTTRDVDLKREGGTVYASGFLTPDRSAADVSVHCFGYMVGSDDYASGFMQLKDVTGGKRYRFVVDMDTDRSIRKSSVRCTIDGVPEEE